MSQHVYSDCFFCGGEVCEKLVAREVWWNDRLHLIDNVPLGVCLQCGQKVLLPTVAKSIDGILAGNASPDHIVPVPAFEFRETAASPKMQVAPLSQGHEQGAG